MALYETVMVKGYEALVGPDTKVDVSTAMIAAGRLQALSIPVRDNPTSSTSWSSKTGSSPR
jgi:hypothetical protein